MNAQHTLLVKSQHVKNVVEYLLLRKLEVSIPVTCCCKTRGQHPQRAGHQTVPVISRPENGSNTLVAYIQRNTSRNSHDACEHRFTWSIPKRCSRKRCKGCEQLWKHASAENIPTKHERCGLLCLPPHNNIVAS